MSAFLPVLKRGLPFLYFFCMFLLPFYFEGNNKILTFFGKEGLNMYLSVHKQIPLFCNHTMETKYILPFISRLSAKPHITCGRSRVEIQDFIFQPQMYHILTECQKATGKVLGDVPNHVSKGVKVSFTTTGSGQETGPVGLQSV